MMLRVARADRQTMSVQDTAFIAERPRASNARGSKRFAPAAVMLAMLLAASAVQAETPTEIERRIEAVFDIVLAVPADPASPLARRAAERRARDAGVGVAALPYTGLATELDAYQARAPEAGGIIVEARLPRPRPEDVPIITGSIVPAAPGIDASAAEAGYLNRFAGSFSGSGEVQRNANERPMRVECKLAGRPSANAVSISGECGAFIVSREISADIRYDPASGRYTGTYVGSDVGPARLSGRRNGDTVVMAIKWPKPVNGDTDALMTIRNTGNGALAITVKDTLQPGGPQTEVTRIALSR